MKAITSTKACPRVLRLSTFIFICRQQRCVEGSSTEEVMIHLLADGHMAQLIERRTLDLQIPGSIPTGSCAKIPLVCHDFPFTIGKYMRNTFQTPPNSGG